MTTYSKLNLCILFFSFYFVIYSWSPWDYFLIVNQNRLPGHVMSFLSTKSFSHSLFFRLSISLSLSPYSIARQNLTVIKYLNSSPEFHFISKWNRNALISVEANRVESVSHNSNYKRILVNYNFSQFHNI